MTDKIFFYFRIKDDMIPRRLDVGTGLTTKAEENLPLLSLLLACLEKTLDRSVTSPTLTQFHYFELKLKKFRTRHHLPPSLAHWIMPVTKIQNFSLSKQHASKNITKNHPCPRIPPARAPPLPLSPPDGSRRSTPTLPPRLRSPHS